MDLFKALFSSIGGFFGRLLSLVGITSSTNVPVTGILGLALVLYGLYQLRGYAGPPNPQGARTDSAQPSGPHAASLPGSSSHAGTSKPPAGSLPYAASLSPAAGTGNRASRPQLLAGVRRITVSVPGVLLEESRAEQLSEAATLRPGAAHALRDLAQRADVFLLAHVEDDVGEATVTGVLEHCGALGGSSGQIPPHRLLFCSTLDGKISFVRQLEPDLHIDAAAKTVSDLERFVQRQVLVGQGQDGPSGSAPSSSAATAAAMVDRVDRLQQVLQ